SVTSCIYCLLLFSCIIRAQPRSTLFPYTTLFRSDPSEGHRIIEIGCVEIIDRRITKRYYHQYIKPDREVDEGALAVHGISNEFLADKPVFAEIVDEFMEFISGAELVIHNAAFDVGFINHELKLLGGKYGRVEDYCTV